MTIASGAKNMTFAITGDTDVVARGASKATKAAGGGTTLTTFVHQGDEVSVTVWRGGAGDDGLGDTGSSCEPQLTVR